MRESDLLRHIEVRSRDLAGRGPVVVGPGDDAAVLNLPGGTLATVDQLVEARHFDIRTTPIDLIARKAVARSVSDIAAMGGSPLCGLATGCLPAGYDHADELFDRMAHWARHWTCPLVGGDIATASGPMVLTVTVLGLPHATRGPVLRSGARPGDHVYVTGALGGSLASGRHLTFEPRLVEAAWLCDTLGEALHAMIDISDGVGRDAARIARASSVRLRLESGALSLHPGVPNWRTAAGEGEDYELLFTAAGDVELPRTCPATGVALTRIGAVSEGSGCFIRTPDNHLLPADDLGWDH